MSNEEQIKNELKKATKKGKSQKRWDEPKQKINRAENKMKNHSEECITLNSQGLEIMCDEKFQSNFPDIDTNSEKYTNEEEKIAACTGLGIKNQLQQKTYEELIEEIIMVRMKNSELVKNHTSAETRINNLQNEIKNLKKEINTKKQLIHEYEQDKKLKSNELIQIVDNHKSEIIDIIKRSNDQKQAFDEQIKQYEDNKVKMQKDIKISNRKLKTHDEQEELKIKQDEQKQKEEKN
jgi:chromosome segregation ATPase